MKAKILIPIFFAAFLFACNSSKDINKRDVVYAKKRYFIANDETLKEKPVFVSLPSGDVYPQGWINDWATDALNGITGHLDEWSLAFGMAWKGVEFEARGVAPNAMGWPLEQSAYWLDGAIKLAYIMNDNTLIEKVSKRLDMVVDGVLDGGKTFVFWNDIDLSQSNFDDWAHSHMGRALVAYYEATGNPRILEALVKVYREYPLVSLVWDTGEVSGSNNVDPMMATYELSSDKRILDKIVALSDHPIMKSTVARWNTFDIDNGHGVIFYENLRIPAMMYPGTGNADFLNATRQCFAWLDSLHMQPHGVASSEEHNAGKGSTRNTETCNVAASAWSYQQIYKITGEGDWGDRIERVFFNAGPAPVSRDFMAAAYYQSPDHLEVLMPHDSPGYPGLGESSYAFRPTAHTVLCCVGNINRIIPNYIQHMWMGTLDKGIAATLYGPSVVHTVVGDNVPVTITSRTEYPFGETIVMEVEPGKSVTFPVYLRLPGWSTNPQIKLNDEVIAIVNDAGFMKIDRKWKKGDRIELYFPMNIDVNDGVETPYPRSTYFTEGGSAGRGLAHKTEVNSPFRTVSFGPLLFVFPVRDIDSNHQVKDEKWNYALKNNITGIEVLRSPMPARWSWQIDEAPIKLKVKAGTFDWKPTEMIPIPETEVVTDDAVDITLVPYGCTKFRISMFPIAKE